MFVADVRADGDGPIASRYLAPAEDCFLPARALLVPRVTVLAAFARSRVLVYWDWQAGYVLDTDRVSGNRTLETDLALLQFECPRQAVVAYGDALVEVNSRFAVAGLS